MMFAPSLPRDPTLAPTTHQCGPIACAISQPSRLPAVAASTHRYARAVSFISVDASLEADDVLVARTTPASDSSSSSSSS
eukprot:CAMPEP_0185515924 /NCGR_PEP_ID=MMETSP1366-20130426/64130_1 /TAXON_ID=38817 /ORGANISM="Gephyrocapsa oceanica, Strain RCC1303" /LENGTH=79 /DNA_ID=CAMNT_0028126793 /DNA_START=54 /DNA_END=290 /DNA_ORIENTATION=+